jgi:MerR HTH family regulatory protein
VRLIRSGEVQALTGLSADQLREWTGRRGLVTPDVMPQGKGTRSRFSWQTVLVLRLATVLKQEFHIELQARRDLLGGLQRELAGRSFPSLWSVSVIVDAEGRWQLSSADDRPGAASEKGFLVLPLAPHLRILSTGFGLADTPRQLPLFAAVGVQ